jgi:hypothetical protein
VIVRGGLAEMRSLLDELSISRPRLIRTERWRHVQVPVHDRFHGARAQSEISGARRSSCSRSRSPRVSRRR